MEQIELNQWLEKFLELDEEDFLQQLESLSLPQREEVSNFVFKIFSTLSQSNPLDKLNFRDQTR